MLSPAQLHRKRLELKAAGDTKALAALDRQVRKATSAAPEPEAAKPSLAQAHRERHAGAASILAAASDPIANDNAEPQDLRADASPATLQRLAMAEDRRQLKALQSVEKRIELKRELLPKYAAYVAGVLDAGAIARDADPAFQAPQDDVLINVMIWDLDVGDLHGAVRLFDFALAHGWALPANFKRNLATFVAEQAADVSLAELEAGRSADLISLSHLEELVRDQDMPDEVRARLHKAIGREIARRAAEPAVEGEPVQAGARRARLEYAHAHLARARDLDSASGVKGDIQRLERELRKLAEPDTAPAPEPPNPDTSVVVLKPASGGKTTDPLPVMQVVELAQDQISSEPPPPPPPESPPADAGD